MLCTGGGATTTTTTTSTTITTTIKPYLKSIYAIAVLVITGSAAPSLAQSSYFVKVDEIQGESSAIRHKNEIEVFSFNLGVKQVDVSNPGGGAGGSKSQFLPVMIYKNVDMASPPLFLACATGKHIKQMILTAARTIGENPTGLPHYHADRRGRIGIQRTVRGRQRRPNHA